MKPITRKIVYLVAMMPLATSCTKSNYNLSSNERAMLTQVKESRVQNAPIAPMPKILPETHFAAGRMFEEQRQFGKAIDQYRKAVAVNHNYTAAYHRLGLLYSRLSHHEHALEALKKAVALEPNNPRLRNNLGFELMFFQRWGEAEAQLRKATELDPAFARAHINLAMVLCKQDRFDQGLASFLTVLPEPDAYYNVGLLYRGQRRYGEATAAFRHVLKLHPGFSAAHKQLEELAEVMGESVHEEQAAGIAPVPPTSPMSRQAERVIGRSDLVVGDSTGADGQHTGTSEWNAASTPSVRGHKPVREFMATNRLKDAPAQKEARVSRTRGRAPQSAQAWNAPAISFDEQTGSQVSSVLPNASQADPPLNFTPYDLWHDAPGSKASKPFVALVDQEPIFTSSVIPASAFAFDDPDCEPDTVLTLTEEGDRDRYRPVQEGKSKVLPSYADAPVGRVSDRSQTFTRSEKFRQQHAQASSPDRNRATSYMQPTTLVEFAELQLDERGPEALAFILGHDPAHRIKESSSKSKPMLVRDRPLPPRDTQPKGKPRTDAQGWPTFLDPMLRDSEFFRSLHRNEPDIKTSYAIRGDHGNDHWLTDFGGLRWISDVVANEILCHEEIKAEVAVDRRLAGASAWPTTAHSAVNGPVCPVDIIADFEAAASVVLVPPELACDPGTEMDDMDSVSIGDARQVDGPLPLNFADRMPPIRH